jgi:hypothetical protein
MESLANHQARSLSILLYLRHINGLTHSSPCGWWASAYADGIAADGDGRLLLICICRRSGQCWRKITGTSYLSLYLPYHAEGRQTSLRDRRSGVVCQRYPQKISKEGYRTICVVFSPKMFPFSLNSCSFLRITEKKGWPHKCPLLE